MSEAWSSEELAGLAESCDLECKAAQGRDGRGELPEDFWKSYSAMANAQGGVILLGVQEKPRGLFRALGLGDVERVRKALWDNLHNRRQISANLLREQDIEPIAVDGATVLRVTIPRAQRRDKPVHLGSNPLGGTYLRRYEGDYQADDETVRRMLAERVEDSRDERVLKGFDLGDLDMETVAAYRNRFTALKPGHVWAELPVPEFLERIGAFGRNREEGYAGPRLAGLLMFGRAEVISDALPNYMLDYQERPEPQDERRWIDRLVPDGTWSGNVYDFFRRVYLKLTAELKVPFQLRNGQRVEDTPVHEALREALVNTLIHADFSGRMSVLVVKRPDMFEFRNPGLMRVPPELAVQGGRSDCRNRRMQTMFQLVGYGDHAGSGVPKIFHNWAGQHWRRPALKEEREFDQTVMELRMTSLLPPEVVAELDARLGDRFRHLSDMERLAMVTAATDGVLSHARLREMSTDHPVDITRMLARLVKARLLISDGVGRGMVYFLPWQALSSHQPGIFDEQPAQQSSMPGALTQEPGALTQEPGALTQESGALTQEPGASGRKIPLPAPVISELTQLNEADLDRLQALAQPFRERRRSNPEQVREVVLALCTGRYLGSRLLASLLGRRDQDGADLRRRILNPLVAEGLMLRAFARPNDPRQAYMTTPGADR